MVRYQCTHLFIEITDLYAGIAQLVERCLAKAKVAGSSPVSCSKIYSFLIVKPVNYHYSISHKKGMLKEVPLEK